MARQLELLITEDNPKHLADAKAQSAKYRNIRFSFAQTLEEAKGLMLQRSYDAVVTDVFFPKEPGGEPTWEAGLELAKAADEKGIPFVYNTSGNHHGPQYRDFLDTSRKIWDDYGFGSGKLIESYPKNSREEADEKQWSASIDYAALLACSGDLPDSVRRKIGHFIDFAPYGDYGKLTSHLHKVLDENTPLEDAAKSDSGGFDSKFRYELTRAQEKNAPVSEEHCRDEFRQALAHIRHAIGEYRPK